MLDTYKARMVLCLPASLKKTGINVDFSMLHGQIPQLNKAEDCTLLVQNC